MGRPGFGDSQVVSNVVSEAALRLSVFVCVAVSVRGVSFPAERAQRTQRAKRTVRAERFRRSADRTEANTVSKELATATQRIYVIESLCLRASLLLFVRVSLSTSVAASGLAKARRSHFHALGRSHKLKRASRSLSNAGFQIWLLFRTRVQRMAF